MGRVQQQVILSVVLLSELMTIILGSHSIPSIVRCLQHHVFTYHTIMYHLHSNTSKPLKSHGGTTDQEAIQTVSPSHYYCQRQEL